MRLLIGMPDPGTRSGPNACEPPFVAALRALDVEVTEQTFVFGDNLEAVGAASRVNRVVRTAWRLRKAARAQRFDLVHLNTSFDTKTVARDSVTLLLLGRSIAPVFLKLHGSDATVLTRGSRPVRLLARHVLGRAAAIGVLSSEERDAFVAAGIPARKLHIVPNALPAVPATTSHECFRATYALPPKTPLLLFISRLVPTKGLLDAVRACALLRDRGRRVVLCCVGDGPARADAEAEAARLELGESVRFFGYLPEAEATAFYHRCDALVFPTFHDEGLPIVLLRALAAGLPILTTRTRAAIDYLEEPDTCLWVQPHRPDRLADRVEELLDDEALRAAMSRRERECARQFEPANVARVYVDLYAGISAAAKASP